MIALVTGGTRGIGRAIALHLESEGYTVVVCGRRPPESGVGEFVAADVRDPEQAELLVATVLDRYGSLDLLVNNAGGSPPAEAATASPRFHEAILRLNLLAPLHLMQLANAAMQAQAGGGVIVNISSVSGQRPSPGTAAYGAAKAGLDSLTASLAIEWAPRVRVVGVSPGLVATAEGAAHYANPDAVAATVPLGRFCTPEEVARAVAWLASPAAAYCTGTTLTLHGGGDWPGFMRPQGLDHPAPGPTRPSEEETP